MLQFLYWRNGKQDALELKLVVRTNEFHLSYRKGPEKRASGLRNTREKELPIKVWIMQFLRGWELNMPPGALHFEQVLAAGARVIGQCLPSFRTQKRKLGPNRLPGAAPALILAISRSLPLSSDWKCCLQESDSRTSWSGMQINWWGREARWGKRRGKEKQNSGGKGETREQTLSSVEPTVFLTNKSRTWCVLVFSVPEQPVTPVGTYRESSLSWGLPVALMQSVHGHEKEASENGKDQRSNINGNI